MTSTLTEAINSGNIDELKKNLFMPNEFTNEEIDNDLRKLKLKKNSAILDINNTIDDKTFDTMIDMLSDYKKTKLLSAKMQPDTLNHMQSFLGGRKKKSIKSRHLGRRKTAKKRRNKGRKTKRRNVRNTIRRRCK